MLEACLWHDAEDIVDEVRRAGGGLVGRHANGELLEAVIRIGALEGRRDRHRVEAVALVVGVDVARAGAAVGRDVAGAVVGEAPLRRARADDHARELVARHRIAVGARRGRAAAGRCRDLLRAIADAVVDPALRAICPGQA